MRRPSGWDVVGFGTDPVPGDPWGIRGLSRRYDSAARAAEDARDRLVRVGASGLLTAWEADSGEVFAERVGDLPADLGKCVASYQEAAGALTWWAERVEATQDTADRALAAAKQASADQASAGGQLASARSELSGYQDQVARMVRQRERYPDGSEVPSGVVVPTVWQVRAARDNQAVAASRVADLESRVDDAAERLEAARRLVADARTDWTDGEQVTATALGQAADAGLGRQSFWDRVFSSDVWTTLVSICKIVVAIGGLIVLVIGGPLAWVVLAAALVLLADTLHKYASGQATGWDLALALLDCIPAFKGLMTAAALVTGVALLIRGGAKTLVPAIRRIGPSAGRAIRGAVTTTARTARSTVAGIRNTVTRVAATSVTTFRRLQTRVVVGRTPDMVALGRRFPDLKIHAHYNAALRGPLGARHASTFRSGSYIEATTTQTRVMYRYHSAGGANGRFLTLDPPRGPLQAQLDNAILPAWNDFSRMSRIEVPPGTRIYVGPAGPQSIPAPQALVGNPAPGLNTGGLLGGGEQVFIQNVPESWVLSTLPVG